MNSKTIVVWGLIACAVLCVGWAAAVRQGHGPCGGCAKSCKCGPGGARDASFTVDREDFHYLLAHREQVRRQVKNLENGVETLTESEDPQVAARIQKHVEAMMVRVKEARPIRRRDPLFAALFDQADKVTTIAERTPHGMRVVATSEDPYAVELIQAHARVVSLFVKNGFNEAHKNHGVPTPYYALPPCWRYGLAPAANNVESTHENTTTLSGYCCSMCDLEPCRMQQAERRRNRGAARGRGR